MTTNLLQRVYDATNNGLDIFTGLIPGLEDVVANPKKKFRLRPDERTPSACLYAPRNGDNCWHIKDFGMAEGGGWFSPIDLYMWQRGYNQSQFRLAVEELAERYGVQEQLSPSVNKPEMETRAAKPEEIGAMPSVTLLDGWSGTDLSCWGDGVKSEDMETYGWRPVREVCIPRGDKVIVRKPTPTYPIFAQECTYVDDNGAVQTFYKVYEPLNPDKAHRFLISGKKPKDYIYGLAAVRRAYEQSGEQRFEKLLLVSGGSDAMAALSRGYLSVWRDSEVKPLSESDYKLLMKYCRHLVVVPDIDATGVKVGQRMALTHPLIETAWMTAQDMGGLHDNRGKQRKDLRDYCHLHPSQKDFDQLINRAIRAQFWTEKLNKEGKTEYSLSRTSLKYFLALNGFFTLKDETRKEPQYIHIDGCMVEHITHKAITTYLTNWMEHQGLPKTLQDKVLRSHDLPTNASSPLRERDDLDFSRSTPTSQSFFFLNGMVKVTAEKITLTPYSMVSEGTYVWRESVIQHNFMALPPQFSVEKGDDNRYHVTVTNEARSKFFRFVRNASRLYWRKVDEQGRELTVEEQADEEQCLVAKLANIGYLLHGYKSESEAWATICQDAKLSESEKDCNGRSGKSFYFQAIKSLLEVFPIEARSKSIVENRFLFDGVTADTDLIIVDECCLGLDYDFFFGKITGPFRAEEKGGHPFLLPFQDSPKFAFGTNYVLRRHDPSTEGRLWPQVFPDFYHVKTQLNDYSETRTIADDFGEDLMGAEYAETDWQADIAFMLQCLQFFLSLPKADRKQMPPLRQIEQREHMAAIGKDFKEWADEYFAEGSGHLDIKLKQKDVMAAYNAEATYTLKTGKFTHKLKEYCALAAHIHCYNPSSVTGCGQDGERLFIYEGGRQEQGYYLQSEKAATVVEAPRPVQSALNFDGESDVQSPSSDEGECPF